MNRREWLFSMAALVGVGLPQQTRRGMVFTALPVSSVEAHRMEAMRITTEEIAQLFRVPVKFLQVGGLKSSLE